nr:MAG TPA: hypothetical protein [Caudoviricetes sp.]
MISIANQDISRFWRIEQKGGDNFVLGKFCS